MESKGQMTEGNFLAMWGQEELLKQTNAYKGKQTNAMTLEQFLFQVDERLRGDGKTVNKVLS